jgi:hypothetical protein
MRGELSFCVTIEKHACNMLYLPYVCRCIVFFNYTSTDADARHACTLAPINTRTQTLPYEHIRKTVPTHLKINEVTTGVSLSTGS